MFTRRPKIQLEERVRRVENVMLALVGKVKRMAEGQAHFEQSFRTLQDSVTGLGRDLGAKLKDLVAAHDQENDQQFETHAGQLDEMINQIQNLGTGGNTATTAGRSPTTTAGRSTGDVPQGRGPTQDDPNA
jgi:hypothetical protein